MKEKLIEDIQRLGLNSYEAKVYIALLERNSLTVSEVSKLSQVPRARTYDILEKLVADGLASLKPGKYKKYSSADFDTFKRKLIQKNETQFAEKKKNIERVTLTLQAQFESALNERNSKDDPLEYIEVIKNPYQVHKKFMQLCGESKKEILIFVKPPYSGTRKQIEQQLEQRAEILKRGVVIKGVYDLPEDEEARRLRFQTMALITQHGEQARIIKELPMKMAVFDERIVIIALEDPISGEPSLTTLIIEHRSLAKSLKILFNYIMGQAEDYHVFMDKENDS